MVGELLGKVLHHEGCLADPALTRDQIATPTKTPLFGPRAVVRAGNPPDHLTAQFKKWIDHGLYYIYNAIFM